MEGASFVRGLVNQKGVSERGREGTEEGVVGIEKVGVGGEEEVATRLSSSLFEVGREEGQAPGRVSPYFRSELQERCKQGE